MKKILVYITSTIALLFLIVFLFPIGKLIFTEAQIVEATFLDVYYVSLQSGESEFDIFKEFMEEKGWTEVEREGSGQSFERNGETFLIHSTDIKTIFINGWSNF